MSETTTETGPASRAVQRRQFVQAYANDLALAGRMQQLAAQELRDSDTLRSTASQVRDDAATLTQAPKKALRM